MQTSSMSLPLPSPPEALPPISVASPATGAPLAEVPDAGPAGVARAVEAARRAAPAWANTPLLERIEALKRFRDAVLDEPRLASTVSVESGKPLHEAEGVEILYLCELIRFASKAARGALRRETRRPFLFMTKRTHLIRKPLGVVGVIGPWNFPLLNNGADAIFPLVMGNTVVLKPSEVTPLTSVLLGELWRKAGNPPDVFQVVTGRGSAGAALVDLADGIMFTGSVTTGRRVAARSGERLIPCVTELGGKSPFLVLEGADLERAAQAAAWSSFVHSGQVCIRTERIYVDERVAEPFEALLKARVLTLRQGAPGNESRAEHDLGAVTFPRQLDIVERQVKDAVSKGASLLTGGRRRTDLAGNFFEPTVLTHATPEMDAMREETFGPLVPVMRVSGADEAVRLANESPLGLNATVFGPEREARRVAELLESGNAIVNDVLVHYFIVEAPLGGHKSSGLGVRHGVEGLRQWTRTEAVTVSHPLLAPIARFIASKIAFPYERRIGRILKRATRILYGRGLKRKFGALS